MEIPPGKVLAPGWVCTPVILGTLEVLRCASTTFAMCQRRININALRLMETPYALLRVSRVYGSRPHPVSTFRSQSDFIPRLKPLAFHSLKQIRTTFPSSSSFSFRLMKRKDFSNGFSIFP